MPEVLAIAIALLGGFGIGYGLKHRRARAEGFLAGRLFERRALRHLIDEIHDRGTPESVKATYR